MLEAVVIEAQGIHRASVIWLHGLGADGHDFEPIVPELGLPMDAGVRFIFPHAPVRPVTLNAGMAMRAWYDIAGLDPGSREDGDGITASTIEVQALIAAEVAAGIAPERMVLAGFSQGGALALHAGLRHPQPLAGLIGLSTYLPLRGELDQAHAANRATPVFMAHGSADPVLPQALGETSRDLLQGAGYTVEWHSYPMAHQVCLEEIQALGHWLTARLAGG
ncbi:MAG: alpha/beta hydrolase [Salinisphaera sp.]|nr:alpha/beta hydrolase [Salinisphaera sp.]